MTSFSTFAAHTSDLRGPATDGPVLRDALEELVPEKKHLPPEWVESLFARGLPEVLRGDEVKFVGMPIGGLNAGQVYLGGDGRLWYWDIFNHFNPPAGDDEHYKKPLAPTSPITQRFSLLVDGVNVPLDSSGFSDVAFRGEYPVGTVTYSDSRLPVEVRLEAFSPFIPLDTDDSSLPATVLQFTVKNTSATPLEAILCGELENGVCLHHRGRNGVLRNRVIREPGLTLLVSSAEDLGALAEEGKDPSKQSCGSGVLGGEVVYGKTPDDEASARGNVDVSKTISTDQAPGEPAFEDLPDFGTMALALLGRDDGGSGDESVPFGDKLTGSLERKVSLASGESQTVTFFVVWHFPNDVIDKTVADRGRYYATKFSDAQEVARYVGGNFSRLESQTKLWRDTWYDSTLPYWFLDRTFLNVSILATSTCHRLANGRFWAWEGVNSCPGTCTSVWFYAQAMARLFPELERSVREMQDFAEGIGFDPASGGIWTRAEFRGDFVLDGQAGNILRAYREHQISSDNAFLERNWTHIKKATEWLIQQDDDRDGIIDGWQSTTLDAGHWWGAMSWTSSLYLAALHACEQMALEMGDVEFARIIRSITDLGAGNLVERLWNGEYFIHKPDRSRANSFIIGNGCHIDQVYGQCWAHQVGLGRVLPLEQTLSALRSVWKYNFAPDVGPYRERFEQGRWYALPGESGTIMTTWPRGDREYPEKIEDRMAIGVGFLNECMNGFEHQVAGHMIREGLILEGLAIERAVHDRYHASKRNPWNELECGDHYSRSMASYGVFLDACGFEYHGPKQSIGFAPRLTPEDFRAAFTAAEGWGTFCQKSAGGSFKAEIAVKWGSLKLRTVTLSPKLQKATSLEVAIGGNAIEAMFAFEDDRLRVSFPGSVEVAVGQTLCITLAGAE